MKSLFGESYSDVLAISVCAVVVRPQTDSVPLFE